MKKRLRKISVLAILGMLVSMGLYVIAPVGATGGGIPPPSGLVSWWPGDGNANDIIGTNHGSLKNGATFATGYVTSGNGQAFSFDGVDDYVAISDDDSLNPTTAITIDAWINPSSHIGSYDPIAKKASGYSGYALEFLGSNVIFWVYISGVGWRSSNSNPVPLNAWTHVAGIYDSSAISLYVNGALVGSPTIESGNIVPSSNELWIGRDPSVSSRKYRGLIDEVEIFNRALSSTEIQSIYNAGTAGKFKSQNIEVAPMSVEFGGVEVDSSTTAILTISNTGIADLTVSNIYLATGSSTYFSITLSPILPVMISPEGTVDVEITFSPAVEGPSSGVLEVLSNDPEHALVEIAMSGTGVITEIPPEQQIAEILTFFDMSVNDGTLIGSGPGNSANGRRGALRNMLEAAGDLINEGYIEEACEQLEDAYKRTDGNPRPPDFVSGEAASELANKIYELIDTLSCQ